MLPGGAPTVVFFPGYRANNWGEFRGLELQTAETGCLARVSRVAPAHVPPLPLGLNLTPAWRDATLHQTLKSFETASDGVGPIAMHASYPPKLPWPRVDNLQPVTVHDQVFAEGSVVTAKDGGWRHQWQAGVRLWLSGLVSNGRRTRRSTFVVEGELRESGLTIGLLRDNRWSGTLNIVTPGPFVRLGSRTGGRRVRAGGCQLFEAAVGGGISSRLAALVAAILTRSFPVEGEVRRAGWFARETFPDNPQP